MNAELEQEFEREFWPNVPNLGLPGITHKVGKGAARRAYVGARKKASKDEILAGLPGYQRYEIARQRLDGAKFKALHPSTWLNGERWTDEIPEETRTSLYKCGQCGKPADVWFQDDTGQKCYVCRVCQPRIYENNPGRRL